MPQEHRSVPADPSTGMILSNCLPPGSPLQEGVGKHPSSRHACAACKYRDYTQTPYASHRKEAAKGLMAKQGRPGVRGGSNLGGETMPTNDRGLNARR